ncbi:MAG: hypothetical protein ACOX0U_10720 [Oscillospiraceae bacterium]|jgi:hypothetical protein
MTIFHTNVYREIYHTALCVIGLSFMMISFYIFTDKFDLSVLLGSIVGSAAAILSYALNVMTAQISAKYDSRKAASIILMSKISRTFLMGFIAFLILLFPILHVVTGIAALFFANIRYWVIKILKS